MDLELRGKVALVTGGSRGIGKAIARELAREGASVALLARTPGPLEEAASELAAETGATVLSIPADTTQDDSVRGAVGAVMERLGPVDVLVNCGAMPGTTVAAPLAQVSAQVLLEQMNVKVMGYLRCIQAVAPHMIERRWGRIVNISGLAARETTSIIGSARNAAVVAMVKNVAQELGPHGITVTTVHPGGTLTERYRARVEQSAAERGISFDEAAHAGFANNISRRPITPEEVAYVVAFLCSPKSAAINGDVIAVGGGEPGFIYY